MALEMQLGFRFGTIVIWLGCSLEEKHVIEISTDKGSGVQRPLFRTGSDVEAHIENLANLLKVFNQYNKDIIVHQISFLFFKIEIQSNLWPDLRGECASIVARMNLGGNS